MEDKAENSHRDEKEEQERERNDVVEEDRSTTSSSANFIGELNLVMMVAYLTLSGDELSTLDQDPLKVVAADEEHHVRDLVSRRRNRQSDAFKPADRQSVPRSQHKILDSRHGRKM